MITCTTLGTNGRLGNQLFQYAALLGISAKTDNNPYISYWKYNNCFKVSSSENYSALPIATNELFKESSFHFDESAFNIKKKEGITTDIKGYFQSEKYFYHCREALKMYLDFKDNFIQDCRTKLNPHAFSKKTIAIHIRRGDYVDNPNYENLSINYYILALEEQFPNWRTDYNLVIFSDDIAYCKVHFQCMSNTYFSEGNSDIEDMCLMSQCDNFIIANSSFSWWGAWLGEKEGTKIVRPTHHFTGKLAETCDIKDLYPERWIAFNHKDNTGGIRKIELSDITFTIPVKYDHNDRKANLGLNVCILQHHFNTNIHIAEQGTHAFENMKNFCTYSESFNTEFHRTKMLNDMAWCSKTPFIANWDADVFIPPLQILESVNSLRKGRDMVYPYSGTFCRMPRMRWFGAIESTLDIGIVRDTIFHGMESDAPESVGGAVMFNRNYFLKYGGENENFISFGAEDVERFDRFNILGANIERTKGNLYHMNHWIGVDSSKHNPHFEANAKEADKVKKMSREELKNYINTWIWKVK